MRKKQYFDSDHFRIDDQIVHATDQKSRWSQFLVFFLIKNCNDAVFSVDFSNVKAVQICICYKYHSAIYIFRQKYTTCEYANERVVS